MKKRELVTKILAGLLVAGMIIGLLPMFASSAEADTGDGNVTTPGGDLHLNKTAVLQEDGTWTITLEAYATGTVKTEVRTQVIPTDIILVLDQSGSMTHSDYYIDIGVGTYAVVTGNNLPTNEQMVNGTYYFWDANDQKYYPITTTRNIVSENSYWVYSEGYNEYKAGDIVCLESEAEGKVATSWSYNNVSGTFDGGFGYLMSDVRLYQRTGRNRSYNYKLVQQNGNTVVNGEDVLAGNETGNSAALEALTEYVGDGYHVEQVTSGSFNRTYYALAYVPVELKNADVYYYTYTYKDDQGQIWTIGHSAEDSGVDVNIADAKYDTALGNIYVENVDEGPRLNALKSAATSFINDMQVAAAAHKVDHRIAVVGFAGNDGSGNSESGYQWMNSELFIGANQYTANPDASNNASQYYSQAFQSVNTTTGYNNLIASIGALDGEGPTYTSVGMNLATGVASANATVNGKNVYTSGERKLVVVFMTDGVPGWNNYSSSEASSTVTLANSLKTTYNAKVYSVALLSEAPSTGDNEDNFLKNVSSDGTYALATNGVDLTNFFQSIEISVDNIYSTVELTQNAFLVDRVSEYFAMPVGVDMDADENGIPEGMKNYVSIYTADHLGGHTFGEWKAVDYEISASAAEEQPDDLIHAWVTTSEIDGLAHGITVHNFNYLSQENMVTTSEEGEPSGRKLIIVIKGVTAKASAALDYYVSTNDEHSGLWDMAENNTYGKLKGFPMPNAKINNRIYVLDYAKDVCLDTQDNTRNALSLSGATDGVMKLEKDAEGKAVYLENLNISDKNSGLKFGNAYIATSNARSKVYYAPMTTNWYGYDTFNVFWKSSNYDASGNFFPEGDPVTGYGWSRVSVMPANNVYYEDTFVTTATDGTTETGRVGIAFGDGWDFTTVGENAGTNQENAESGEIANGDIHGWIESLEDDNGFTDGTVAVGKGTEKATATFTFTGTGMDLYSYTDNTTGTIIVQVKPLQVHEGYTVPTRYFIVDNYAASGEYYSIPTVSYMARGTKLAYTDENGVAHEAEEALVYGQYQVTINVTTAAAEDGNRVTYYLDGIRVYNPLGSEQENNPTVGEGYGDEVHAFFYNIRDYLLSENDFVANSENAGAVFIDQIKQDQVEGEAAGEGVSTAVVGTYKDYGPKNEVYLAGATASVTTTDEQGNEVTTPGSEGQMIVMKVDIVEGRHYFVSLKAPVEGTSTTVELSNGNQNATVTVDHTADLYYEVIPTVDANDPTVGYIAIHNTGNALLSVGKYQITGLNPNPDDDISNDSGASVMAISGDEAVTFARTFARMASAPYVGTEEPESDNNVEAPEIDIENPENETPDQPSIEEEIREKIEALVARLFKSVRDWFHA